MQRLILSLAISMMLAAAPALALSQSEKPVDTDLVLSSAGFLDSHPDLLNRHRGMEAYEAGRQEDALGWFRRAANYADKPSQAMVAEILWKGEGVARDAALAYAWMDLAAERGYPEFTVLRERYWAELDEAQRAAAIKRGAEVYAEYGDEVAKPRIAAVLRRGARKTTGSRTGFVGALKIILRGPGGTEMEIDGNRYYDRKFWEPELYHAWHDAVWMGPREGRVNIGEVEPLRREDD